MSSEVSTVGGDQSVEELRRELDEAHRRETATAEVLRVISRSGSEAKPVLDIIASSALNLVNAQSVGVTLYDGDLLRLAALHNSNPEAAEAIRRAFPRRADSSSSVGRALRSRRTVEIPDVLEDPAYELKNVGFRSVLSVPMLRNNEPIGVIAVGRDQPGRFSEKHVELFQTFAAQAVIAIENARLFEQVHARTAELQESLEYQTATAEVLKVISNSPTDIKPVLNAICETAIRICGARDATLFLRESNQLVVRAHHGPIANIGHLPISRDLVTGRALLERTPIHVLDTTHDPGEFPLGQEYALQLGYRTILAVPLIREDVAIGVIGIRRTEVRAFSDKQIKLLQTFANQAVIAIENARLFEAEQTRSRELTERTRELTETLEYQTATSEVLSVISRSPNDVQPVLDTIARIAQRLCQAEHAFVLQREEGGYRLVASNDALPDWVSASLGEAIAQRQPLQVPDIFQRPSNPLRDAAIDAGLRAGLIVPLFSAEAPLGALVLQRRRPGEFPPAVVSVMQSFADQSAIALENARLFDEIAQKSRELEIASQHKSQFVANMSHELRTPLAAILGYAELMQEGFYEPLGQKSKDALTRIRSNGKHLLGLINTVLDIAKIESGQFTLNMAEYAIESVVETVRSATESLAQNKKLALKTEVAQFLPIGLGDEQRLTQVLLNLVGNAIKFTDTGEVRVTAKAVNGHFNVSVTDTGPGIPLEHQARIFEQFHQVDSSNTKAKGGTGLGLAISKQIVEMHGGRIWVESMVGKGSTVQMELPTRAEFRKMAT